MASDTPTAGSSRTDVAAPGDVVDAIGDKIADLRAHLCHGHPLRPDWIADLDPAELAAVHRRLHGRAVAPDDSLVDVRLLEVLTHPEDRATTALPLVDATCHDRPLVWLPLRVADLVHVADAPGHTDTGGCRACADVIEATIRALVELDDTPARRIADLEQRVAALGTALEDAREALATLIAWAASATTDDGEDGSPSSTRVTDAAGALADADVLRAFGAIDALLDQARDEA